MGRIQIQYSTTTSIDDRYFRWLCNLIGVFTPGQPCYKKLARVLSRVPFYSDVARDSNRAKDGLFLREIFLDEDPEAARYGSFDISGKPCSMLEMCVALAKRLTEITVTGSDDGYSLKKFFWEMMGNLGLENLDDSSFDEGSEDYIRHVVTRLCERRYGYDGSGGLFPLRNPPKDQRDVEIWYQMSYYLQENYNVLWEDDQNGVISDP